MIWDLHRGTKPPEITAGRLHSENYTSSSFSEGKRGPRSCWRTAAQQITISTLVTQEVLPLRLVSTLGWCASMSQ
jgi:hypothetical protein